MLSLLVLHLFIITISAIAGKNPEETYGILLLDSITFPKIVPSMTNTVLVLICKKGSIGNYGTDSIRSDYFSFATLSELQDTDSTTSLTDSDSILFTQIIVNGAQNKGYLFF